MARRFEDGVREILDRVGGRSIVGKVEVDQVYAQYQHEGLDLKHPAGGKAKYLQDPLFDAVPGWMRQLEREVLAEGPRRAMRDAVEEVASGVYRQAPLEFGDLKASPHPTVKDGGRFTYDRPAAQRRLTKHELRIKGRLHSLGLGN